MASWPNTLPACPEWQYSENYQDGRIRSDMDAGPAKLRRRFTVVVQNFSLQIKLTSAQVDTIISFYDNTLEMGTATFKWFHPRTQDPASCRFVSRPAISGMDGLYSVSFEMEILPS